MYDYDVAVAYDGRTAIQTAERFDPDVILLDLALPDIDGYAVARGLRDAGLERASVVAVSGFAPGEIWSDVGFIDHLVKPVGKDALISLLDRVHAARS
jgi:CheY-like chemotaxis protein